MNAVQDIFRAHGRAFIDRMGSTLPPAHRKVVEAIQGCRSGAFGKHLYRCPDCEDFHVANSSCGNRHCPVCQSEKSERWLNRELENGLPCPYFMLTFTVPEPLRPFLRAHPREGYGALFEAAADSIKTLAADKRFVGCARPGFTGILHTWGRQLQYHPHLHFIVPGGGLSPDGSEWLASKPDFFVHVRALSRAFRSRFQKRMKALKLNDSIDPTVWKTEWNVHSQPVGDGRGALRYLANYVFRVAITGNRIRAVENGRVSFAWQKVGSRRERIMTLDVFEFIRRFLDHVLPSGFMKIRRYGFLHPNTGIDLDRIRTLICVLYDCLLTIISKPAPSIRPKLCCASCGSPMKWLRYLAPPRPSGPG